MKIHLSLLITAAFTTAMSSTAQNAVTDWSTIASTAIVTNGGEGPGASGVWFAYTSIAMYDAVNTVHHAKFKPFYYSGFVRGDASDAAAAAAAAHRILVSYFPTQQSSLDAGFQNSLKAINASPQAKSEGVQVGEDAAAALLSKRTDDGLNAAVPYTPGSGPGAWQPQPPTAPPVTPWLGQMRPFTMESNHQFLPDGPTALSSQEWVADYNLTRLFGDANSTLRTPGQTEIGLFWTMHTAKQYSATFNNLVQHYNLDLMESARLLAMLWTGYADAAIGCFNGKYHYGFWRPQGAIPAGGDNPDLAADPLWTSLAPTPNHPEYPAAHACLTGAVTELVADYFGTRKVHVTISSSVFSDGVHTHTFEDTGDWLNEVYWARMFAGFHFNHSLQDGGQLGKQVAHQLFANYFLPERDDR